MKWIHGECVFVLMLIACLNAPAYNWNLLWIHCIFCFICMYVFVLVSACACVCLRVSACECLSARTCVHVRDKWLKCNNPLFAVFSLVTHRFQAWPAWPVGSGVTGRVPTIVLKNETPPYTCITLLLHNYWNCVLLAINS